MKRKDALWVMQMCRDRDARSEAEREAFDTAIEVLKSESIFTADRPRGEWIIRDNPSTGWYSVTCSECGDDVTSVISMIGFFPNAKANWDFCPNCGADMRSE